MRSQLLMCKTVMLVLAVAVTLSAAAWADCGSIPFFSPIRARETPSPWNGQNTTTLNRSGRIFTRRSSA